MAYSVMATALTAAGFYGLSGPVVNPAFGMTCEYLASPVIVLLVIERVAFPGRADKLVAIMGEHTTNVLQELLLSFMLILFILLTVDYLLRVVGGSGILRHLTLGLTIVSYITMSYHVVSAI